MTDGKEPRQPIFIQGAETVTEAPANFVEQEATIIPSIESQMPEGLTWRHILVHIMGPWLTAISAIVLLSVFAVPGRWHLALFPLVFYVALMAVAGTLARRQWRSEARRSHGVAPGDIIKFHDGTTRRIADINGNTMTLEDAE